jgi:hypothetical protein
MPEGDAIDLHEVTFATANDDGTKVRQREDCRQLKRKSIGILGL